jgi:V/A-type H+-transporting ATPase subunit F
MYKIGVLGDRDSVLGFKALGIEIFIADDALHARPILRRLAGEDYAVIYVTECLAEGLHDEIETYKDRLTPAVIVIPGKDGLMGLGMESLKSAVKRAVGADILHT